jgi:hypothetical protein
MKRKRILAPVKKLFGWQQLLLVFLCILLGTLFAQLPFSYNFLAGKARGPQSDRPFLQHTHAAESKNFWDMRWRWTHSNFTLDVPGIGQRGVLVHFSVLSHRAQWEQQQDPYCAVSPTFLTVETKDGLQMQFPLRLQKATYHMYIPPDRLADGSLHLAFSTRPWQNPTDLREDLGIALGEQVHIESVRTNHTILPDMSLLLAWSLGIAFFWSALRVLGFGTNMALLLLLPVAVGVPLLSIIQAPRLGFGNAWIIEMGLMSLATAVVAVWLIPPLLRRLQMLPRSTLLRWLLLLVVLSFVLKYGGRLYPESMPGDLQLHVNRSLKTLQGNVYIEAQHRGLPFPFPNGPYLLLFPFMLAGIDLRLLLQLSMGIYEALTVVLLYILLTRVTHREDMGVLAGATYALTAGGFMNTWFTFHTQVAAQFFSILLLTILVVAWPNYRRWSRWGVIVLLFILVFLGHIGLFLNTSLVGLLIIPLLWWRNRQQQEQRSVVWLLAAGLTAVLFVFAFYYSAFLDLIIEQTVGVAASGLNEVTGRDPIPRATTLQVTWEGGLITHFGFFPIVLAVVGSIMLSNDRLHRSLLPPLVWLTFLVSASQAVLPLITLNSITTRWLMFSSWAIAVTASQGAIVLKNHGGRAGRWVSLAMCCFVCWITLALYVDALALRLPPIEPF